MKKRQLDRYETQLSEEELAQLHKALLQPGVSLAEIQEQAPAWRKGPQAGRPVGLKTLARIAWRLRIEHVEADIQSSSKALQAAREAIQRDPSLATTPTEMLDTIFILLGQEILESTLKRENVGTRVAELKLLLKRHDQLLAKARFKRETCRKFLQWFDDQRVRRILESRDSNAVKIEKLGQLLYGESW